MKKLHVFTLCAVAVALSATSAVEASIEVGDRIRFTDQAGTTGGGEFGVHLKENRNPFLGGNGEFSELFRTFCLERNEAVDFNTNGFVVDSISKYASAGGIDDGLPTPAGTPDEISADTAWLFYNFSTGVLAGYDYGAGRVSSADDLQNAIWGFENEISQNSAWDNNPFVVAALGANTAEKETAFASTFVLNILWATDRHGYDGVYEQPAGDPITSGQAAQSMLYVMPEPPPGSGSVPEATSIAVWSALGLICMAANRQRASCR